MLIVNYSLMTLSIFYWMPIILFGFIYLIKLSKNISNTSANQVEENS